LKEVFTSKQPGKEISVSSDDFEQRVLRRGEKDNGTVHGGEKEAHRPGKEVLYGLTKRERGVHCLKVSHRFFAVQLPQTSPGRGRKNICGGLNKRERINCGGNKKN